MAKFFEAMKNPESDQAQQQKFNEVLLGGRGEAKRHYAVDQRLYGTVEGVTERKKAEEEIEQKKKKKIKAKIKSDGTPTSNLEKKNT